MATPKQIRRRGRFALVTAVLVGALTVTGIALGYVATDQPDYSPGSVVTISGGNDASGLPGYVVGNTVDVAATADNGLWEHTCSATVAADETWSCTVTLSDDPAIAVGSYHYTATSTNANGNPISETGTFTDAIQTATSVTSNNNPSTVGQSVTFTATVKSGNPATNTVTTGQVKFGTGANCTGGFTQLQAAQDVDSNGQVTFTTSALAQGTTTIRACYLGSGSGSTALQTSDGTVAQTVNASSVTDETAPVITFDQTPNGSNGWFKTAPATVTVTATDTDDGGVASLACKLDGTVVTLTNTGSTSTTMYGDVSTSTDGNHTVSCQAADSTGNTAFYADNTTALKLDTVAPAITITTPADGTSYILGQSVTADFGCTDGTSGVSSCTGTVANGAAIDTSTIGAKSFTVNAGDYAGNTNTKTVNYNVIYDFTGFFQPVDNNDVCNVAKAGSAIPIKFSLDGYQGMDIIAEGYPKALNGTCAGTPLDPVETTSTAGNSSLNYDPTTDQYIYVWKTQKTWAGKAIKFDLELVDGTHHYARFTFTK